MTVPRRLPLSVAVPARSLLAVVGLRPRSLFSGFRPGSLLSPCGLARPLVLRGRRARGGRGGRASSLAPARSSALFTPAATPPPSGHNKNNIQCHLPDGGGVALAAPAIGQIFIAAHPITVEQYPNKTRITPWLEAAAIGYACVGLGVV